MCAAIMARHGGASVLVLEAAPKAFRGGNSRHTRNLRYMHEGEDGFLTGTYPEDEFYEDLLRVTGGDTNEELARYCIRQSQDAGEWMSAHGIKWQPSLRGSRSRPVSFTARPARQRSFRFPPARPPS